MSIASLALIFVSVALSALAQLLMKAGMSTPAVQSALAEGGVVNTVLTIAFSPLVVLGLLTFASSAATWLLVLARVPVSQAYPFVALGIVLTAAGGYLVMGEALSLYRVAGIVAIALGVVMVASN
jgi:drug/metabolite transporter (DMT)-like permease